MTPTEVISVGISIPALAVSFAALGFTVRGHLLKSGQKIRGSYSISSSISCEDRYVSSVMLHNQKDKSVAIFNIYLQLGHGIYLRIDDFQNEPKIIGPFETLGLTYDPIEFYSLSTNRAKLDSLLGSTHKPRPVLVVGTAEGRYTVKDWIQGWNPYVEFFENHMTAIVTPVRSEYRNRAYGANALYVLVITNDDGKEYEVPVYKSDHQYKKFKNFRLTEDALVSKETLEEFLVERIYEGKLSCQDIKVHDITAHRAEAYDLKGKEVVEVEKRSWFMYNVLGRAFTVYRNFDMRRKNRAARRRKN